MERLGETRRAVRSGRQSTARRHSDSRCIGTALRRATPFETVSEPPCGQSRRSARGSWTQALPRLRSRLFKTRPHCANLIAASDLHVERAEFAPIIHVQRRGAESDQGARALAVAGDQRVHVLIVESKRPGNAERRVGVPASRFEESDALRRHASARGLHLPADGSGEPLLELGDFRLGD